MSSMKCPRRNRRRESSFGSAPTPVHSAHVGEELEVHYRWHPYFGRKVGVRRVEHRATGQFLKVQGPAGVVVSIAGWMLDPVVCAGMTIGPPQVDLGALVDLQRLFTCTADPAHSRSDVRIVREEGNEASQVVGIDLGSTDEPVVRHKPTEWTGVPGAGQGRFGAGSDPAAGSRRPRRGACR